MKISIKNMVCDRCIMIVQRELEQLDLGPQQVMLGEAEITRPPSEEEKLRLSVRLRELGFEIIEDPKVRLVEEIKRTVLGLIHSPQLSKNNFSDVIAQRMHREYSSLSKIFSEIHGTTLEQFIIHQKIERVKILILEETYSLSEIADHLQYSSASHLTRQFKKIVQMTPSQFRSHKKSKRIPLDKL